MTNQQQPNPNPIDMWRQFITDSERQWNSFFKDVLGTDAFSNSMNAWVEGTLTVQRMVADQLERLYTTFNIPTHGDLVDLGERMKALEESFTRLESMVEVGLSSGRTAKSGTKSSKSRTATRRPPRTKRPPAAVAAAANKNGA